MVLETITELKQDLDLIYLVDILSDDLHILIFSIPNMSIKVLNTRDLQ